MRNGLGATLVTATAVIWGGQWVVGRSALGHVDAFNLTTLRYAWAGALLLLVLVAVEGRDALRFDGHGVRLFGLGTLGFAGFNLFAYVGLEHATATSASLITSLAPLLAALLLWLRGSGRPTSSTVVALAIALFGVAVVLGHGDPASVFTGAIGSGDILVLAGVSSFLVYTVSAGSVPGFSPLRYTALTASLGWVSILAATVIADATGLEHVPSAGDVDAALPSLAYIAVLGAVVAVTTWNLGVARLGTQNASLFMNLMPVTTFAIAIGRGYHPSALELGGAALTILALVGANVYERIGGAQPVPVLDT
jgi:drug/metabolite transporter (DMT)-like permease